MNHERWIGHVVGVMTLLAAIAPVAAEDWQIAGPGHDWSFPADHHAMPEYRSEWWYVTGQVGPVGGGEPTHGLQMTIFRVGLAPERPPWQSEWTARDVVLGHLAISDLRNDRHVFSEVLARAGSDRGGFPSYPDSVVAWVRAPAGTMGRWQIVRRGEGFALRAADRRQGLMIDLALVPERPRIFQGPGGYSVKDPEAAAGSLYYSYTRLATSGLVAVGGDTLSVSGLSWFDREVFTSQLASRHAGWDWMGLHLSDGRDLMAFALRDTTGAVDVTHATLVEADGSVRWFDPAPGFLTARRWWTSPETGGRYPVAWRIALPEVDLEFALEARFEAQENVGRRGGTVYWEGAVQGRSVDGVEVSGYVEMTGYGGGALPF